MRATFNGLNIALSGLQAQQAAIDVTSHNIANANTQGYSRKTVTMVSVHGGFLDKGEFSGRGVDISDIRRVRDAFLDLQTRNENRTMGEYEVLTKAFAEIERIMAEPSDTGIRSVLDRFWNSLQDLSGNPEDESIRQTVIQSAGALADAFSHTSRQLSELREDVITSAEEAVNRVNTITKEILSLNDQIRRTKARGEEAGDLMDRRDLLLDDLSKIMDIEVVENKNGAVRVVTSVGPSLVEENSRIELGLDYDGDGRLVLRLGQGGPTLKPVGGELRGYFSMGDVTIPQLMEKLGALANSIITEVNAIQAGGFTLEIGGVSTEAGPPLFMGTGASDISVNPDVESDPRKLAASTTGLPGDGGNALLMAQLKQAKTMDGGNSTWDENLQGIIVSLAIQADESNRVMDNQRLLLKELENRRLSISGVSLDEEMTNLVKYQQSYNAAARTITVIDDMLTTLIKETGVAGR